MEYQVGDKVLIKSIDWYYKNKDKDGDVPCGEFNFVSNMTVFCGKILTIDVDFEDGTYLMKEDTDGFVFTKEMIEGLVRRIGEGTSSFAEGQESHTKSSSELYEEYIKSLNKETNKIISNATAGDMLAKKTMLDCILAKGLLIPNGYEIKDENGNVINATKISLCKKSEVIPNLQLDSIRTVREYCTDHSRIWLEIYEDNLKVCVITHLWVDEDHRRKGYGTKALEQAEIIAKDLGCDTIHLKVETYSWMSKWYLRSGYTFLTNAKDNYTWLTKSI